jgi:CubicO group peptidase (beta-lactamase class C family)
VNNHTSRPLQPSIEKQLRTSATRLRGFTAPALSYAFATADGTISSGAIGFADLRERQAASTEDQYPWFSMTKIATATAIMRLHADGHLDLDAPVGEFVPAYAPGRRGHPTVRQLLTHTAGLANPLPIRWVRPEHREPTPGLLEGIVNKHGKPRRTPGGRAAYSNIGYLLTGQVIEAVTNRSVEQVITDQVLRPLGMDRTGFTFDTERPRATGYVVAPPFTHPLIKALLPSGIAGPRVGRSLSLRPFLVEGAAYGGLIGPASDAVKLAIAHVRTHDQGPETGPLGDLGHMCAIQHPGRPFDHGMGWFRKPTDADRSPSFVEHYGTGGGFWNAMRIYPHLGLALVGMTNTTGAWPFDKFFTDVVESLGPHAM